METIFYSSTSKLWVYAGDPDNNVTNQYTGVANFSDLFFNSQEETLFFCTQGGEGTQTWKQMM